MLVNIIYRFLLSTMYLFIIYNYTLRYPQYSFFVISGQEYKDGYPFDKIFFIFHARVFVDIIYISLHFFLEYE